MAEEPDPAQEAQMDPEGHEAEQPPQRNRSVRWLSDYVYGTISTLVAIAGLTFETNPGDLTTAGVVVVGAVAIWLAHAMSRLVIERQWQQLQLRPGDVGRELWSSWSIVAAAVPATIIFTLAGLHVWSIQTAFSVAEAVGVLALAVVGFGTTRGSDRSWSRRILYVAGLMAVGVAIVLFELLVHLLKAPPHPAVV
jgi:type IV secretory pathway VirB2 component (pilin)